LNLLDDHDIFNTDTKFAVLVIAGFVGDSHTGFQGDVIVVDAGADTMRAFVDAKEGAHTVTGTMSEVKTSLPEGSTRKDVQDITYIMIGTNLVKYMLRTCSSSLCMYQ
jgi:hypothetical protein